MTNRTYSYFYVLIIFDFVSFKIQYYIDNVLTVVIVMKDILLIVIVRDISKRRLIDNKNIVICQDHLDVFYSIFHSFL
jgi:hypothetical protein